MDERSGNRRDFCTEVALSGMGRTPRQARRHCSVSGDQIFLSVRLFSTNFPSFQPGKTKLDFLQGSCKSSALKEYIGLYTRVLICMKTPFALDTCARHCVQPSYFFWTLFLSSTLMNWLHVTQDLSPPPTLTGCSLLPPKREPLWNLNSYVNEK